MESTSWETLGWKKHKLESRLSGEISINNLRDADDTTLMAKSEADDESERGEWKSWLKAQHLEN